MEIFKADTAGYTITTVAGTAIAGTRTSATVFTRSAGVWYDRVIIDISAIVESAPYTNFSVGETVTESTSTSTGVVEQVTATQLVLKTISAAWTGAETITGGTSGVTATGGTAVNVVTNLKGQLIWSHASGTLTAGTWCKVKSNTASAITIDSAGAGALNATGTAIIIQPTMEKAREAMDIDYGS
jgi:hypothetical protein